MLSKYSNEGRAVISAAEAVARLYGMEFLNTDHMLLALTENGPRAREAIKEIGVEAESIRKSMLKKLGKLESIELPDSVIITKNPRTSRALDCAEEESKMLHLDEVGSESMLLGILRDSTSQASQILEESGVMYSCVRDVVARLYAPRALRPLS